MDGRGKKQIQNFASVQACILGDFVDALLVDYTKAANNLVGREYRVCSNQGNNTLKYRIKTFRRPHESRHLKKIALLFVSLTVAGAISFLLNKTVDYLQQKTKKSLVNTNLLLKCFRNVGEFLLCFNGVKLDYKEV